MRGVFIRLVLALSVGGGACGGEDEIVDPSADAQAPDLGPEESPGEDVPLSDVGAPETALLDAATARDAALDGRADAAGDARSDAATDANADARTDAGTDASGDAGTDAGTDAGSDAGVAGGYDLFLLAGQSNMVGRGAPRDMTLDAPDPMAFQWGRFGANNGRIVPATARLEHNDTNHLDRVGMGLSFAKAWLARTGRARPVLLIPTARGATSFTANEWNPGNPLFEDSVARANAAMQSHPGNRFVGILWHQGEADVGRMSTAVYSAALDRLVYRLRGRIVGAETALFVVGEFCPQWRPTASVTSVLRALDGTPMRVPFSAVAPSAGLVGNVGDTIHFNAASQRLYGGRYDVATVAALANRPHATPPSAPLGVTVTPTTTSLAVSWRPPSDTGGAALLGYRIALRPSASALWNTQYALTPTFTFTGLTAGTRYELRVVAHNPAGVGDAATATASTRP